MRISPLPLISRLGLALCLLAFFGPNSFAQDAARFEKEWEQTKKLGRDGRWSTQVNLIRKILAEHEGRPYVRAKRTEIEAEIRNAQFGVAHPLNDARSLIPGEVKAFNRYSGKLKVRLNDPKEKKSFKNLVCPIVFDGPHSISLRGDAFRPPLRFVVCFDNKKGAYDVTFNGKQEVIASTLKGRRWSKLSTKKAPLQTGRPYNVQVKVSAGVIEAKVGTRSVLRIKKARDHFGQLTLGTANAEFTEVEGQASKAWLQGLVDTERSRLFTAFQKNYKPKEELPAWLYETADLSKAAKIDPKSLPGGTKDGEEDSVKEARKEILKALRQRNRRKGLESALAIARNQKLRPIVSLWLESTTLSMAGDIEGALIKNAELLKKEPAFDRGRLERAVLYRRMKDLDRCRAILDDLIARYPDDPRVIRDKVNFLLISGGNTEGRKLLQSALARGVEDKELIDLERLLVKAEKGPAWSKPFEVKTRHYIVRSNMNREICREAAQVLEAGYLAYKAYLPARASDSTERFPVYIFNSEKGYLAYSSGITGSLPVRSAGLYSPVLQQLLIWNLPNHEQIMQTVRHEGLHQYVDRVMPPPARWFNEGHAEYFEAARGKSSWKLGLVRKDHVRTLTKMSRRPEALRGFLDQGDYQFLRNAGLNYAMSWLLVHFLHHGGIENKQILRKLFNGYMAGKPHDKVWDIAFEKVDFKEFEQRLWEHYRSLSG